MSSDFIFVFFWWLLFLALGLAFWPLTRRLFAGFYDRGYIFAKILGILLLSYTVFLLGTLKILPFLAESVWLVLIFWALINLLFLKTRVARPASLKIIFFEELLFFAGFVFWAFVRSHEPSVHSLEKFMDFGFINSILRADFFPPPDIWLTPHAVNYYYFGHLVTAVLTKLSGIDSSVTYNLMLATLFGLTFVGAFSLGLNLFTFLKPSTSEESLAGRGHLRGVLTAFFKRARRGVARSRFSLDPAPYGAGRIPSPAPLLVQGAGTLALENLSERHPSSAPALICGLLSAFLVTLAGNLHTFYAFLRGFDRYWYPDATRFIPNTIHEFPSYSWVVADLHGHALNIPFVLLTLALLLALSTATFQKIPIPYALYPIPLLLAVLYMTNAWDGIIYFGLTALILFFLHRRISLQNAKLPTNFQLKSSIFYFLSSIFLLIAGFFLFSLPFNLNFKPFVHGLGVVGGWEAAKFLGLLGEGSAAVVRLGPFLLEKGNNLRSPFWMLLVLWGFFYFVAASFLAFVWRSKKSTNYQILTTDYFILILILLSTLLLIFPEFFYIKDIYPLHYRANTMFKLGYQAFIMLSLASAYIIARIVSGIKYQVLSMKGKILSTFYFLLSTFLLLLVAIYPYFAIRSYYGDIFNLQKVQGLNGLGWLSREYPGDWEAILWLRENVKKQPVILEAAGESYTDFARVSANTGLPTVVGWPVHEWLWRGSYDEPGKRVAEVQKMYESVDLLETQGFLEKYQVAYVFVGTLERQKYPTAPFGKWKNLGSPVFSSGQTVIYKIH